MQATREDFKSLDQGVIQRKGPNIEALRQPLFAHVVFIDNIFCLIFGLFKVTVVYHSKVSIGTKTFLHIISFCLYLLSLYYKVSRNSWIVWNFNQHYDALGAMRHTKNKNETLLLLAIASNPHTYTGILFDSPLSEVSESERSLIFNFLCSARLSFGGKKLLIGLVLIGFLRMLVLGAFFLGFGWYVRTLRLLRVRWINGRCMIFGRRIRFGLVVSPVTGICAVFG